VSMKVSNEQITQAISGGINTNTALSKHFKTSRQYMADRCREMHRINLVSIVKGQSQTIFKVVPKGNFHDPFRLCRAPSETQRPAKKILSGKVGGGFGERKRHCLDDFGDVGEPALGDGSRFASEYGRPEKLSDII